MSDLSYFRCWPGTSHILVDKQPPELMVVVLLWSRLEIKLTISYLERIVFNYIYICSSYEAINFNSGPSMQFELQEMWPGVQIQQSLSPSYELSITIKTIIHRIDLTCPSQKCLWHSSKIVTEKTPTYIYFNDFHHRNRSIKYITIHYCAVNLFYIYDIQDNGHIFNGNPYHRDANDLIVVSPLLMQDI